jgi:hypothetical protein
MIDEIFSAAPTRSDAAARRQTADPAELRPSGQQAGSCRRDDPPGVDLMVSTETWAISNFADLVGSR